MENFRNVALSTLLGIASFASLAAYDNSASQDNTAYNQRGFRGQDGSSYQQDGSSGYYQQDGGQSQGYQGQQGGYYQGQSQGYQGQQGGYYQGQSQDYQGQQGGYYQGQQGGYQGCGQQGCPQCSQNQYNRSAGQQQQYGDNRAQNQANSTDNSNEAVASRVLTAFQNDKSLSTPRNVQVTANDGKVTLTGTVKSDDEKSKVESIAKQVSGVKSVANQVTVSKGK